jgi:hypothetical protein
VTPRWSVDGWALLPLPMTATKDDGNDCGRDDGWRNLYDDEGNPFANQGHCIAWVTPSRAGGLPTPRDTI